MAGIEQLASALGTGIFVLVLCAAVASIRITHAAHAQKWRDLK